jgi:protein TonB
MILSRALQIQSPASIRGWSLSLLVHGLAVGCAVWLVSALKPDVRKEPFRWEIAFIESPVEEPVQKKATPVPPTPPNPPRKKPVSPIVDTPTPKVVETRPVEKKPVIEARPMPQVVHRETVQTAERRQPTDNVEQSPVGELKVHHREAMAAESGAVATERTVISRESTAMTQVAPTITELSRASQEVQHNAIERPLASIRPEPVQEANIRHEETKAPVPVEEAKLIQPQQTEMVPARARPGTSTDNRWLAEMLWRRVAELKHYPSSARLNGWEGKVVLRAVIRADGHLADVTVQKSSGYEVLDNAAIQAVKLACPLHMKHQLDRPQIVLNLPIVYSLSH